MVREEEEPREVDTGVADAPDLPVDDGRRPLAPAQDVAETEVAVGQHGRDVRRDPGGQRVEQLLASGAEFERHGPHGAGPSLQFTGRIQRWFGGLRLVRLRLRVVQVPQYSGQRQHPCPAQVGNEPVFVEDRLDGLARHELHGEPRGFAFVDGGHAGYGHR